MRHRRRITLQTSILPYGSICKLHGQANDITTRPPSNAQYLSFGSLTLAWPLQIIVNVDFVVLLQRKLHNVLCAFPRPYWPAASSIWFDKLKLINFGSAAAALERRPAPGRRRARHRPARAGAEGRVCGGLDFLAHDLCDPDFGFKRDLGDRAFGHDLSWRGPSAGGVDAIHQIGCHLSLSANIDVAARFRFEAVLDPFVDRLRDLDTAGKAVRLHTTRQVHRLTPQIVDELRFANHTGNNRPILSYGNVFRVNATSRIPGLRGSALALPLRASTR